MMDGETRDMIADLLRTIEILAGEPIQSALTDAQYQTYLEANRLVIEAYKPADRCAHGRPAKYFCADCDREHQERKKHANEHNRRYLEGYLNHL